MGIDVCMFAVVRGEKPSEALLNRLSLEICECIGSKYFFVQSGLPLAEYEIQSKKWGEDFNNHPYYLDLMTAPDRENQKKIREQIIAVVGEPPKLRIQALELIMYTDFDEGVPIENREPGKAYMQDAEPILASEDEWYVKISVFGRYYGVEYESGDIFTYCKIAEWLEVNLPNCMAVYYGGDSSGVQAKKFDEEMRNALRSTARSRAI